MFPFCLSSLASAKAKFEADLIYDRGMQSELDGGIVLSPLACVAGVSDCAAVSTTKEFAQKRDAIVDLVLTLHDKYGDDIGACPVSVRHHLKAFLKLDSDARGDIRQFGLFRCSAHVLNLVAEKSWMKSEVEVLTLLLEKNGDSIEHLVDVQNLIRIVSKLFATGGDGGENYLNESGSMSAYAQEEEDKVANGLIDIEDSMVQYTTKLANLRGSRQNIFNELAADILNRLHILTNYLETRVDATSSRIVEEARKGLGDRYVIAALSERAYIYCSFLAPMVHFCHSLSVSRLMLGKIMKCARAWVASLLLLPDDCAVADAPKLDDLAQDIISDLPELKTWSVLNKLNAFHTLIYVCFFFS
jgi:hypothetical protein